ncbi:MAG: hypothetical protein J6J18_07285 [Oscillospiraceae bacterium]|nr:hypothetical protein [Oscillospiraceae bacterium]
MNKFYLFRQTTRIVGILSCIAALIAVILNSGLFTFLGFAILGIDIILIAVKNRCPFCRKTLMLSPLKGQEFCPHCGCQVH